MQEILTGGTLFQERPRISKALVRGPLCGQVLGCRQRASRYQIQFAGSVQAVSRRGPADIALTGGVQRQGPIVV